MSLHLKTDINLRRPVSSALIHSALLPQVFFQWFSSQPAELSPGAPLIIAAAVLTHWQNRLQRSLSACEKPVASIYFLNVIDGAT